MQTSCSEGQGSGSAVSKEVKYKQAFELHTHYAIVRTVSGEDDNWCIQFKTEVQRKKIFETATLQRM